MDGLDNMRRNCAVSFRFGELQSNYCRFDPHDLLDGVVGNLLDLLSLLDLS